MGGNVSVITFPTRVNVQEAAVVIAPVQAVDAAVISSYQLSNWLVIPAAGVLAVKLMPLAAVPWIRLPTENVIFPALSQVVFVVSLLSSRNRSAPLFVESAVKFQYLLLLRMMARTVPVVAYA
jgi:hypothetical protein